MGTLAPTNDMKIDHASPMPLHAQVEQLIRELLAEKRYQDGELLPPEALMAEKLAVSRNTVRAAISRLVHEGMLERKAGRGTRYVKQPLQTNLRYWPSFTTEMQRKGVIVETFSLHTKFEKADDEIAAAMHLNAATKKREILRMDRTRGHDGIPAVYSVSWFHPRTKITTEEDYSTPLYALIQKKSGITVVYSEEQISAICADEQLAGELRCEPGDPLLVRKRTVRDAGKNVIEYNVNYYRGDRFTYHLTIEADTP